MADDKLVTPRRFRDDSDDDGDFTDFVIVGCFVDTDADVGCCCGCCCHWQ